MLEFVEIALFILIPAALGAGIAELMFRRAKALAHQQVTAELGGRHAN